MIFDWLKIGAGVAIISAVGFAGLHYKSLLNDRDKLHDAEKANKELNQTIVQQRTEIALIDTISKDLSDIKHGISQGKRERQKITDQMVAQNAEYKQWRDLIFPSVVNDRLRESANNINKVNSGRSTASTDSKRTDPAEE